jgi:catechol 2,3-dioxygenase-like lactoylglutathione lyase family enzyme
MGRHCDGQLIKVVRARQGREALAVGQPAIPRYTPPMSKRRDPRPPVAIGHVSIAVRDVAAAARWFAALGLREIAEGDDYAVLELRGGTHLVVERAARRIEPGREAPFDLMYDDIEEARRHCRRLGLKASPLRATTIHRSFTVAGPEGYRVTINSSHAGKRAV